MVSSDCRAVIGECAIFLRGSFQSGAQFHRALELLARSHIFLSLAADVTRAIASAKR